MSYFILMGRRIPKQAITGFKFQNETDNIRPFLSIRIRGKDEIIPFKDKKEIQSVKAHLCSIFSGFVKIGDWYLKMSEVKEYKPVTGYNMIESGKKKEEYREHNSYWAKRFYACYDKNTDCKIYIPEKCKYCCKPSLKYYDAVRFRYGYTKRTMLFKLNGISIGKGHSEWGAPDNEVFILKLGNRIN